MTQLISNENKRFYKRLTKIALPIALQGLISSSLILLDNLMVSRLGELPLTAVGLATQIFSVQFMLIFGFCTGAGTFFTQFWGVQDLKNIKKVLGIAISTCFALSLIFFIFGFFFPVGVLKVFTNSEEAAILGAEYLKVAAVNFLFVGIINPLSNALHSTEQTIIPMYISIASFLLDAGFNYLLIFGKFGFPALGVKGAAIATVIARIVELLLTIYIIFGRKNIIAGTLKEYFDFDKEFAIRVYKNAIITTIHETLWSSAIAAQNAAFGRMGVTEFAAIQASRTIMDLFQTAGYCIGDASMIMVGELLGQKETNEAKRTSGKLMKSCLSLGVFMMILLIALNRPLISLFNLTELGKQYTSYLIIIRAVYLPINLLNALLVSGLFRAGGDTRFAAISEIIIMWAYSVPAAFIFGLFFKLSVSWVMILVQLEGIIKLAILLKRYYSGKWLNNMIEGM